MEVNDQININFTNLEIPYKENFIPLLLSGNNKDFDKWKNNFQILNHLNSN